MLASPKVSVALYERVLNAFPARDFAFGALLEIVDICESSRVPTAAVECRTAPKLLLNTEFVSKCANTPEKLLMLVLHELNHVLLGHTRLFPMATPLDNLVFDALINAMLCKALPALEYRALFTDFYSPERFPECMLRPPGNPGFPTWPFCIPKVLNSEELKDVKEVYEALYLPKGVTYEDLRRVLGEHGVGANGSLPVLLGNHSEDMQPSLCPTGEGLRESLHGIVRHWPKDMTPIPGRPLEKISRQLHVNPRRRASKRAQLQRLLEQVGGPLSSKDAFTKYSIGLHEGTTAFPTQDRRATVLNALGARPMLFAGEVATRVPVPYGERVHVYLDVSGSVHGILNALYGAVLDCESFVHPKIHLFSNVVKSVSLAGLREGECHTTGGTDINCVADHMKKNRVQRAALVTDGYVGKPGPARKRVLEGVRLGVALIPGCSCDRNLKPYAKFWTTLGDLADDDEEDVA